MRWTIFIIAAAVLLAAGIAISQQPSAGGAPPANPAAAPPAGVAGGQAPLPVAAGQESTVLTTPAPPGGYPGSYSAQPYVQILNQYAGRLFATDDDPQIAEFNQLDQQLEHESRDLVNQLAQAPEDDAKTRDELKQKLREALERQFDAQQKIREKEVTRIEERVKKLRDVINKRNAARRTIVDRRQQQLIDDAEGYGWSSPGTGGPNAAFNPYSAQPGMAPPAGFPRPIWIRNTGAPRSSVTRPGAPGGPLGVESPAANEAPARAR